MVVLDLIRFYADPARVFNERRSWFLPYGASFCLLLVTGLFTQAMIIPIVADSLASAGHGSDTLQWLRRGAYIGAVGSALILPLVIPWAFAFVSKVTALFLGYRMTFSDYFRLYQWGTYASTLPIALTKLILFAMLPMESWQRVNMSLSFFVPREWSLIYEIAAAVDLSLILLLVLYISVTAPG